MPSSPSATGTPEARIDGLLSPLTSLYDEIEAAAPGDRVNAGGYPLLVPDPDVRAWCYALTFLITSAERDMIRTVGARLSDVIDQAAAQAGAEVLASRYARDIGTQADFVRDSFHPTVDGQYAYAAAFEAAQGG